MQAVIMAGGKGTRLSSVLKDIPKPMVPIMNKPLLEYQIENLRDSGITDIMLVVGHLGEVIRDYFKDGRDMGVNISYYSEDTPLGTAGALFYLKEWIENDFILLFGDLFVNINFRRFYDYHLEKQAFATLYVHPNSHPYDSDILVTNSENRVTDWSYKSTVRMRDYKNLVNAGVYVLSKGLLRYIPENQKTDLEKQVLATLLEKENIYAYPCTEYVKDIGTPERLQKVEADLKKGICEKRNLKYKQKCIFLDRDGTLNKHVGFLNNREQMELEQTVAEAIRKINESEYLAIVISNQPVIARGECSFEELDAIHHRMDMLLGEERAYLDDLYYCPHHPDSGFEGEVSELKFECDCRKPKIGLLEKASFEHNIDLHESWIIGDTTMDIQTGINGGLKTALVLTGEAGMDGKYDVVSDITGKTLLECVNKIIRTGEKNMRSQIENYFNKLANTIKELNLEEITEAVEVIRDAYEREATIYIFGNGGSSATASHFVGDFNKGISEKYEKKFNLICLSDNTPIITAIANDISYDDVFYFQLKNKVKKDDLILAISGSGNSKNVIKAVEYAKEIGTKVVGITGYSGGKLRELADYHMHVAIDDMQITEDIHMSFDHMMYRVLGDTLDK